MVLYFTLWATYRLHYDSATDTYHDTEGVETRIPGFGNTSGIEYLDPHAEYYGATVYFHPMVSSQPIETYISLQRWCKLVSFEGANAVNSNHIAS